MAVSRITIINKAHTVAGMQSIDLQFLRSFLSNKNFYIDNCEGSERTRFCYLIIPPVFRDVNQKSQFQNLPDVLNRQHIELPIQNVNLPFEKFPAGV